MFFDQRQDEDGRPEEEEEVAPATRRRVSSHTGFSSEIGTKLRDWAVGQAEGSCCSQAALSSNDSKTL